MWALGWNQAKATMVPWGSRVMVASLSVTHNTLHDTPKQYLRQCLLYLKGESYNNHLQPPTGPAAQSQQVQVTRSDMPQTVPHTVDHQQHNQPA